MLLALKLLTSIFLSASSPTWFLQNLADVNKYQMKAFDKQTLVIYVPTSCNPCSAYKDWKDHRSAITTETLIVTHSNIWRTSRRHWKKERKLPLKELKYFFHDAGGRFTEKHNLTQTKVTFLLFSKEGSILYRSHNFKDLQQYIKREEQ